MRFVCGHYDLEENTGHVSNGITESRQTLDNYARNTNGITNIPITNMQAFVPKHESICNKENTKDKIKKKYMFYVSHSKTTPVFTCKVRISTSTISSPEEKICWGH